MIKYILEQLELYSQTLDKEKLITGAYIILALSLFFYIFNVAYFFFSGKNYFKQKFNLNKILSLFNVKYEYKI